MYSYSLIEKVMSYLDNMVYKMEDRKNFNFFEKRVYDQLLAIEVMIDKDNALQKYIKEELKKNEKN